MKSTAWLIAVMGTIAGCSGSSYSIHVIEGMTRDTFRAFSKGADVKVGEIFSVYQVQTPPEGPNGAGGHARHGRGSSMPSLRHTIGRVQVVELVDETHARVKVLSGHVDEGALAQDDN